MHWYELIPSLYPLLWGASLVREIRLAGRLRASGVEVAGQVVRQREVLGVKSRHLIPTVRFTTLAGQLIEAETAGPAVGLSFRTGKVVHLRYDPARPARLLLVPELGDNSRYERLGMAALLLAGLLLWYAVD